METVLTRDPHFRAGDSTVCTLNIGPRAARVSKIEPTAAKIASPAPVAVVARKQRRPCVESGGVAAADAVGARIAAIVIAGRVAPTCVRVTIAIVVIVVPR